MILRSLALACVLAGVIIAVEHRAMTPPPAPPKPEPAELRRIDDPPLVRKADQPVTKPVRLVRIWTPEDQPDFQHSFATRFRSTWPTGPRPTIDLKAMILASLPPARDEVPPRPRLTQRPEPKPERHRSETAQSHLQRYCARPGKTERSWIRVKGVKKFCPS